MKKISGVIFGFICVLLFGFYALAGNCETYMGSNKNAQNYGMWASTVKSYLHVCNDGVLMRVQYLTNNNKILVEYYDSDFELSSQKIIDTDFPVFGGFYAVDNNYFVLTGQNNPGESSSVTCFAITKYDENWNKIAVAELKDCNTTVPFNAGSARFCHVDKYLFIRTSHEMYKSSDGYNHQANATIQLDIDSMKITDSFTGILNINYGYVSHSFNQFIKIDADRIVALDHGDAYPRSIVLVKYATTVSSGTFTPTYIRPCTAVDMLSIAGKVGDNYTYCSVGGFEITSSGYLTALNSIKQGSSSSIRNIYLSYCDKNSATPELKQLTYYSKAGVSTPHLVKIDKNRFIVLWYFDGRVHYCETDGMGNLKGDIMTMEGALSDCQPIVSSDKLIWYVWNNEELSFYSIKLSDIAENSVSRVVVGHDYSPVGVNGTSVRLVCSKCGSSETGKVPSDFALWWEELSFSTESSVQYSSQIASSYHLGDTIRLMVKFTSEDLNEYEIVSDNESIAKVIEESGKYSVYAIKEGVAEISVRSKYNHSIKNSYIFTVSHQWVLKESVAATCESDGRSVKVCSICGESKTEILAAKGHKMSSYMVIEEASCKSVGIKKATCTSCGYYDTVEIPKKDHDKKVTIEAIDATCTKQGKSEGKKCSVCGKVTVEQETIEALGHNLGAYKITKAPTCTAQGEETATCTRCTYSKTQSVARIGHTEVVVKGTEPTCTKQGKTSGSKCSVCGRVIVEQETIEDLGHNLGAYKITKAPTCTAQGEETATCTRCTYSKTQSVARIAHTEVVVKGTEPTCTKQGKTSGSKCSVCGKIIVEQETIEALGHNLGAYKITKAPTCTAQGEETATCTRCTYSKTQSVARKAHTEVAVKGTEPTCTKQGKTSGSKCSVCGRIIVEQETIEALGHNLGAYKITKAPTCTAQGEETATCTRCTYSQTQSVARIAHTEVVVKGTEPTCTKQGKTSGSKCSVCGKITVEQETIEALGHDLDVYKVTVEPTCTTKGKKTGVCTRCTYTVTQDIEKTAHTEFVLKAVDPTCTKSGKTEGKKCSVCDKTIVAQEKIDALGHSKKVTVLASATTKANGVISTVCETCGEKFGEQRVYRISSISLSSTKCTYNGKTKTPSVRVVDYNKDTLVKGEDYTVTYENPRKNIGKYSVRVRFIGKYSGSEILYYEILPGKTSKITATQSTSVVKLNWSAVKGANGYRIYQYDSKSAEYKHIASVRNVTEYRVTKLKAGTSYKFAVKAYYKDGSGKVYFSDSMKAVATATEPAVPLVSVVLSGKTAVIGWNKCPGADGYQIYYSSSKDGKYKKLKSTSLLNFKKTGLISGKKYYFKVRAYKKTSSGTVYGEFSKVQSIIVK